MANLIQSNCSEYLEVHIFVYLQNYANISSYMSGVLLRNVYCHINFERAFCGKVKEQSSLVVLYINKSLPL